MDWSERSTPAGWRLIFAQDIVFRRMFERASLCLLALPVREEQDCQVINTERHKIPPPRWRPPIPWRSISRSHLQAWMNMRPERREPWA